MQFGALAKLFMWCHSVYLKDINMNRSVLLHQMFYRHLIRTISDIQSFSIVLSSLLRNAKSDVYDVDVRHTNLLQIW